MTVGQQLREEGRLSVIRTSLLRVLARRGFSVSDGLRQRINEEPDFERLERWLDAAVTVTSLNEVISID